MNSTEKKKLYERIVSAAAVQVKKAIDESFDFDDADFDDTAEIADQIADDNYIEWVKASIAGKCGDYFEPRSGEPLETELIYVDPYTDADGKIHPVCAYWSHKVLREGTEVTLADARRYAAAGKTPPLWEAGETVNPDALALAESVSKDRKKFLAWADEHADRWYILIIPGQQIIAVDGHMYKKRDGMEVNPDFRVYPIENPMKVDTVRYLISLDTIDRVPDGVKSE